MIPAGLVLTAISRWPTRIPDETIRAAMALPVPVAGNCAVPRAKRASVVVVTYNGLPYTKMCLASVLGNGWRSGDELIVVDNGSSDGTVDYLRKVAKANPCVVLQLNSVNRGFAAANNQGLKLAGGEALVLLNNDTIVVEGWLDRLMQWLHEDGIGMAGPVTNRTCNEAQIDAPYRTYAELEQFAGEYTREHTGIANDIRMLAMFCLAMRRDVFERVGLLDEQFEVGMFEDDDYARRVLQANYRIVCAEDVFVHHFGQGSLGELCTDGKYDLVLEANRRRFEQKWAVEWQPHDRRITREYEQLRQRIQEIIDAHLPSDATVMVINKGDEELLRLRGRIGRHFPQGPDGRYPNIYPADSVEAIAQLKSGRAGGAGFLVVPKPAFWWLEYYGGFKEYLERNCKLALSDEESCLVFDIRGADA